ncbi:23479_t:CDS:2, partial [Gigaspora rosea]
MAPQKIKITKNEIPNAILSDDVYDICCQYFTNGRLTSIYDPHKYFCNQSNKFHTTLRNINEELKKIMIIRLEIYGNGSRRDSTSNESICEETSNNTIVHSSSNRPTLVNSCEKGSSKDSTAANEEISNSTIEHSSNPVVDNSSSQSQHQVINIITGDNNR